MTERQRLIKPIKYYRGRPFIWETNYRNGKPCPVRRFGVIKKCEQCKKEFVLWQKGKTDKYCSRKCYNLTHRIYYKCLNCGKEKSYVSSQKRFYPNRGRFCSMTCMWDYYRKYPEKQPCWKNGREWLSDNGYLMGNRGMSLHRIKAIEKYGVLKKTDVVHHINLDKTDNNINNLWVYYKKKIHHQAHWRLNRLVKDLLEDEIIIFKDGEYYYERKKKTYKKV